MIKTVSMISRMERLLTSVAKLCSECILSIFMSRRSNRMHSMRIKQKRVKNNTPSGKKKEEDFKIGAAGTTTVTQAQVPASKTVFKNPAFLVNATNRNGHKGNEYNKVRAIAVEI